MEKLRIQLLKIEGFTICICRAKTVTLRKGIKALGRKQMRAVRVARKEADIKELKAS